MAFKNNKFSKDHPELWEEIKRKRKTATQIRMEIEARKAKDQYILKVSEVYQSVMDMSRKIEELEQKVRFLVEENLGIKRRSTELIEIFLANSYVSLFNRWRIVSVFLLFLKTIEDPLQSRYTSH